MIRKLVVAFFIGFLGVVAAQGMLLKGGGTASTPPAACSHSSNSTTDGCAGAQAHGSILYPTLADPQSVIALNIDGGSGYTDGTYSWTSTGGGCSVAASGTITVSGGKLGGGTRGQPGSYTIVVEGAGCTSRPTIVVPGGAGGGTGGVITPSVYQLTPHNALATIGINWSVAGVDYPVGYDTTLSLADPTTAGLPSGCTFSGSTVTCAGSGGTLNGYDFSLHITRLNITAAGWTITNNKFKCGATISALQTITIGTAVNGTTTIKYNTVDGGAGLGGTGCVSGGMVASLLGTNAQQGTVIIQYNYCFNADSKCVNFGGNGTGTTLVVHEDFNYYTTFGICGGGCAHGEAEYSFGAVGGGNGQIIDWGSGSGSFSYNVGLVNYYQTPSNLTSALSQTADGIKIGTNANHNYGLLQGTQSYTGSNNNNGQVASAAMFCGHQEGGTVQAGSTMTNNIWEYSGGFFPYNPNGGTCNADMAPADFNAGTGNTCTTSSCN